MKKIIAREYSPCSIDFRNYFDYDGMKEAGGENCAVYIPGGRNSYGFNNDELQEIVKQAEAILEGFEDIGSRYYSTHKEVMLDYGIAYTSRKCYLLKAWAKNADAYKLDDIAGFLTITTGKKWETRAFHGYSQGDYCEVMYCVERYTEQWITEIGNFWLGCGTEFEIDNCGGYYVMDTVRWHEGAELVRALADMHGCNPDDLEVHLYDGEVRTPKYRLLELAS